ncbi:WH2 domain-containing protein [Wolbachia endosymbiont (group B) of Rhopobota naevana]|uniref:WH2 domain-containing protein n=1 Tax=Wolbachia endosymbiont (group B) of Rhopobota naevana TaxID=2954054 RepID=UPI00222750E6|nr:WH2 domain-containing protein [Wolbachia endosymbiont (group B) of Rhopobota naevana]
MLTNNNNTPSSAPPPPPPPADWRKNWKPAKNNDKNENTLGSTPSKTSNSTQLKKVQSKSPVQQSPFNFEESLVFKKIQEKNNVDSETADEGSNIRQSEPNRGLTPKPVSPRVLSPQQDNCNSNKPSGTNNSTQSEKGLSENPIQLATEQKIDTPILINTLVGISKTAALKYSIATLLLCISSVTAGIYTYLSISVTLSDPVLFTVIAFVSASVMLSLAAYLINSHLSAINSEKKVDPGRKQSQDLQKAKGLEHSNTHTSSPPVALRTSSVPTPPPPPLPQNAAPLPSPPPPPTASKYTEKPKNGAPKKANESKHDRSDLLEQIRKGTKLKPINDGAPEKAIDSEQNKSLPAGAKQETKEEYFARIEKLREENKQRTMRNAQCHDSGIANILKRRPAIEFSSSESEVSDHSDSDDWSNDKSKKPKEKKLTKSRKKPTPSNSQPEDERGSKSPDSGHESDDNVKPKSTTPPRSTLKAEKPPISPKPVNSKTKSEASPAAQANNVDSVNSEVQKPFQVQSVVDRGKRK